MKIVFFALLFSILSGCTSLRTGQEIGISSNLKLAPTQANPATSTAGKDALIVRMQLSDVGASSAHPAKLEAVMQELGIVPAQKLPSSLVRESALVSAVEPTTQHLPDWSYPFMRKVIVSHIDSGASPFSAEMRNQLGHNEKTTTSFDRSEITDFIKTSLQYSGLFDTTATSSDRTLLAKTNLGQSTDKDSLARQRLKYYLFQYFTGNYVDHLGIATPSPKIASALGNDTIIPLLTVILDAFFDEIYSYPVLVKDETAKAASKDGSSAATLPQSAADCAAVIPVFGTKQPTYVSYRQTAYFSVNSKCQATDELALTIRKADSTGKKSTPISVGEAGTMRFAGELGNQTTQAITGFAIRELGGLHVSAVVVGGIFTIGSNDTLSKAIETVAAQISQRNIEEDLYETFLTVCNNSGQPPDCGQENTRITQLSTLFGALFDEWKKSSKQ